MVEAASLAQLINTSNQKYLTIMERFKDLASDIFAFTEEQRDLNLTITKGLLKRIDAIP